MQAPRGPEEDTTNAFTYGGWQFGSDEPDEVAGKILDTFIATTFELLLGRKTYDLFTWYWHR